DNGQSYFLKNLRKPSPLVPTWGLFLLSIFPVLPLPFGPFKVPSREIKRFLKRFENKIQEDQGLEWLPHFGVNNSGYKRFWKTLLLGRQPKRYSCDTTEHLIKPDRKISRLGYGSTRHDGHKSRRIR
ncbi:hypothetical protein CP532_5448, partial [Ophiocordyceps camponoti-leonardi (nom. inval.)]